MPEIHPSSLVDPAARLGEGVRIGPFCTVGPDVTLGPGTVLMSHVVVDGHTTVGEGVMVHPFATIGLAPQHLGYRGEPTRTEIGARTVIREHVTIHRGTPIGTGVTKVGADCLLMCVTHIAHDCAIGDRVIFANNAVLGGHVTIGDNAVIGGAAAIHQWVRIGRQAMVGGASGVEGDVIPFGSVIGNRARLAGLNVIGLKRRGFDRAQIHRLRAAFRLMFRDETGTLDTRMAEARQRFAGDVLVEEVLAFMGAESHRPLCRVVAPDDLDLGAEDPVETAA
jgi:UDP-N-acetylglucosamine acyltransferase